MKITDMLISAILKKGILYEANNCNMDFEIPMNQLQVEGQDATKSNIKITFKAEHMTLRIEKE